MMKQKRYQITPQIYYFEHDRLGKGAYGEVFRGVDMRKGHKYVAIKRITINNDEKQKSFDRQKLSLQSLNHQNIVKSYGCFPSTHVKSQQYIIMQLCEGTLKDQIDKYKKIPERIVLQYLKQILDALTYANQKNILHRDIKPDNIFITHDNHIKVGDFGVGKRGIGSVDSIGNNTNFMGSFYYMAPQTMTNYYNSKCDVWSFGIVVYEMLTGINPIKGVKDKNGQYQDYVKIMDIIKKGELKLQGQFHPFFKQIIEKTIVYSQQRRLYFKQLKQFIDQKYPIIKDQLTFDTTTDCQNQLMISNRQINYQQQPYKPNIQDQLAQILLQRQLSDIQQKLKIIQQSNNNMKDIYKYVQFMNRRSQLFLIFFNYIVKAGKPYFQKYQIEMLSGIVIGAYCSTLDQLLQILNSQQIVLPTKTIKIKQLFETCYNQYKIDRDGYIKNINQKYQLYIPTLIKLNKLFTPLNPAKANDKDVLFYLRNVKRVLTDYKSQKQKSLGKDRNWFILWYNKYFSGFKRQMLNKISQYPQNFKRIIWASLQLAEVQKTFPQKEYINANIIDQFHDNYQKKSIQDMQIQIAMYISNIKA